MDAQLGARGGAKPHLSRGTGGAIRPLHGPSRHADYPLWGRANEIRKEHIPKSYTVEDQDGTIEFASYSERVYDCKYHLRKRQFIDPNATLDTENCTAELAERSIIPASFLWNDVWMYDLNCTRKWQQGCSGDYESQWTVSRSE